MKITQSIILLFYMLAPLFLSSCATLESKYSRWDRTAEDTQFKSEKATFNERLNGKEICYWIGVASFTYDASAKPDSKCLYPDIKIARVYLSDDRQWSKSLKVLQVLDNGFIVTSDGPSPITIFIHKTDQVGVVDKTYLAADPNKFFFYEYAGPYSYNSLTGKRTVHSFKKVDRKVFIEAQKGLTSYYFIQDMFGNAGLIEWADAAGESYKKFGLK